MVLEMVKYFQLKWMSKCQFVGCISKANLTRNFEHLKDCGGDC